MFTKLLQKYRFVRIKTYSSSVQNKIKQNKLLGGL